MKDNEYILITGSAGLLGSRLAEYIINRDGLQKDDNELYNNIIGIDLMAPWGNHNQIPGLRNFQIDLSDWNVSEKLDSIFQHYNIKYVYHFASYAAEGLSYFMRTFNHMNNIVATSNIINACLKNDVRKLIYTSSTSVYGNNPIPYNEDQRPDPQDPYAISKYSCEQEIQVAGSHFGLNWTIIRPHNVFGRGQNMNDTYRNVIGIWMHQIWDGQPITIYGDGKQTRCFTEMANILEPLYRCMSECNGEIINIGGVRKQSLNELADLVLDVTGTSKKVYLEPRREVKFCDIDPTKSIKLLDYRDELSIEEGIRDMWQWAQSGNIGYWYKWNNFELDKGLYEYWK